MAVNLHFTGMVKGI